MSTIGARTGQHESSRSSPSQTGVSKKDMLLLRLLGFPASLFIRSLEAQRERWYNPVRMGFLMAILLILIPTTAPIPIVAGPVIQPVPMATSPLTVTPLPAYTLRLTDTPTPTPTPTPKPEYWVTLLEPLSPYRLPKADTPHFGIGIAGQMFYPLARPPSAVAIMESGGTELDRRALILRGNDFEVAEQLDACELLTRPAGQEPGAFWRLEGGQLFLAREYDLHFFTEPGVTVATVGPIQVEITPVLRFDLPPDGWPPLIRPEEFPYPFSARLLCDHIPVSLDSAPVDVPLTVVAEIVDQSSGRSVQEIQLSEDPDEPGKYNGSITRPVPGRYTLKAEVRADGKPRIKTSTNLPWAIATPEPLTPATEVKAGRMAIPRGVVWVAITFLVLFAGGLAVAAVWLRNARSEARALREQKRIEDLEETRTLLKQAKESANKARGDPHELQKAELQFQKVLDRAEDFIASMTSQTVPIVQEAWLERFKIWDSTWGDLALSKKKELIDQVTRTASDPSLRGLKSALEKRWAGNTACALKEIYGIIESSDQWNLLRLWAQEWTDRTDDTAKTASVPQMVCGYLSAMRVAPHTASLSDWLTQGRETYRRASLVGLGVADQMEQFYDLLSSMSESFSPVDFREIPDITEMPDGIQEVMEVANRFSNPSSRDGFPVSKREQTLEEARERCRECSTPEAALLRMIVDEWLDKIRQVSRAPYRHQAKVVVGLTPSLAVGDKEEESKDQRWMVRLPVAVHNHGPGRAYGVKIIVKGAGSHFTWSVDRPPEESLFSIKELKSGEIKVYTITFQHAGQCSLSVGGHFFTESTAGPEQIQTMLYDFPGPVRENSLLASRNPYILTPPIPKEYWNTLVYEREGQLRSLMDSVRGGRPGLIALKGLRRTGKTTLLRHFCDMVSDADVGGLAVYIDCLNWRLQWEKDKKEGHPWNVEVFLHKVASVILQVARYREFSLSATLQEDEGSAFEQFSRFMQQVRDQIAPRPLVLVFDEADSLVYFPDFRELLILGFKPIADGLHVHVVMSYDLVNSMWEHMWTQDRLTFADDVRTPLLSRKATNDLATNPLGLRYTPLAAEFLWRVTGGYPALIQLVCHHLVEDIRARKVISDGVIRVADLKDVVGHILISRDERQYIDYLRYGFGFEERRLLLTLIRHKAVDSQTGQLKQLSYVDNERTPEISQELCRRFLEDWARELLEEAQNSPESNPKLIRMLENAARGMIDEESVNQYMPKLEEAAAGLLTKQVIDFYDGQELTNPLRLRVGFLNLFLK